MFRQRRAFRLGESGRFAPDFVVARAAVGLLVLHELNAAMRLHIPVALCVPKGEPRGDTPAGTADFAAFTTEKKLHTPKTSRSQSAHIISAPKHLQPFPN
jgi:hypothetical protein